MNQNNVVELKQQKVEAQIVSQNLTLSGLDYLRSLHELGAFEGRLGNQSLSAELVPLLEAIHHVLAGGSVEVKVTRAGNSKVLAELDDKAGRVLRETNEVNCSAGYGAVPFAY
jgi:hypothetical protein